MLLLKLILVHTVAGAFQTVWLRAAVHRRRRPIDGGLVWRGKPLFGPNKTWQGLWFMTGFCALAGAMAHGIGWGPYPEWTFLESTLWMGAGGLVYMLGELPNSFLKRRLGIPSGGSPPPGKWRVVTNILDELDSVLTLALFYGICFQQGPVFIVLLAASGTLIHRAFNRLLVLLKIKSPHGSEAIRSEALGHHG